MSESEPFPEFHGYQMQLRVYEGELFTIWEDGTGDWWISDHRNSRGFCLPNEILHAVVTELNGHKTTENERSEPE